MEWFSDVFYILKILVNKMILFLNVYYICVFVKKKINKNFLKYDK